MVGGGSCEDGNEPPAFTEGGDHNYYLSVLSFGRRRILFHGIR